MDWLIGFQFTLRMSFQSYQKRNPSQNCMLGAYNLHKYQITFSKTFQNTETTELTENSTLLHVYQKAAEALDKFNNPHQLY